MGNVGDLVRDILFDGIHEVSREEVLEKMKYYMDAAEEGQELNANDPRACLEVAKKLRGELDREYKNNSLRRIQEAYRGNRLLEGYYSPAVHQSSASITGKTTQSKAFSFLYNVGDYMRYHMPK